MNNIKSPDEWDDELSSDPTVWHYDIHEFSRDKLLFYTSHQITLVTLFTNSLTTYFYVNDKIWKIDELPKAITQLKSMYGSDLTYMLIKQLEIMLFRERTPSGPYRDVSSFWTYFFKWE